MSQRDGFAGGFLAGAIFGSVVGGFLGAVIATRRDAELIEDEQLPGNARTVEAKKASSSRRRQIKARETEENMEMARLTLEEKIAQLNATIDEVRQQLGNVNNNPPQAIHQRPSLREDPN